VNLRPDAPAAIQALGTALLLQKKNDEAEAQFNRLLEADPKSAQAWFNLGIIAGAKKDMDSAERNFEKALALNPQYLEALINLNSIYRFRNQPEKGLARMKQGAEAAPKNAAIQNLYGEVLIQAGRFDEARPVIDGAIKIDPKLTMNYVNMGNLYRLSKRNAEAEKWYLKAIETDPKAFDPQLFLATLYEEQKQYDKAIRHYEKAVGLNGDSAVAKNNLAYILAEHGGNIDRALELAQSAKEQFPDNPSITDTLGWIYYKKNITGTAIELFKDAIAEAQKQNQDSPTLHYHLALAYKKAGDLANAKSSLAKALQMKPDFPEAAEARKELASLEKQGG
jgi:tetratricopeptide (TPR) repeat protein